jgi:predicted GH43/DUF377 family glycosyl hydrolase/predicted O-methyltransferase YrrM
VTKGRFRFLAILMRDIGDFGAARTEEEPHSYLTPFSHLSGKRLSLPEADAFNGASITSQGKTLIVFRTTRDKPSLASCYVDRDLRVVPGTHRPIPLYRNADPRLIEFCGEAYLVTSYFGGGLARERVELRKMNLGDRGVEAVTDIAKFDHIAGDPAYNKQREKNWAPFVHEDTLYFVHRLMPHRIVRYEPAARRVSLVSEAAWKLPKGWPPEWHGDLRLSTNPVRLRDGTYLSTFHSSVPRVGYFSGFYRFNGSLPFRVLEVSLRPIITPADATELNLRYQRSGVVFLQSMVLDQDCRGIRLTGGDNDHSVVALDLQLSTIVTGLVAVNSATSMVMEQELFFSIFKGPRRVRRQLSGRVSEVEMAALIALIRSFRCKRLAEFGVGSGANAATILQSCPEVESYVGVDVPPGTIPSLEYQAREVPGRAGHLASADPRFKLIIRERGTLQTSVQDLGPLDFVFIDGDHGVEAVRHDTVLARSAVTSGIICWHDYDNSPAVGPKVVIDDLNATEGSHICLLKGTTLCFEVRRQDSSTGS